MENFNGYHASVFCVGVKNRCRKSELHSFELVKFEEGQPDIEDLKLKARAIIRKNMKKAEKMHFTTYPAQADEVCLSVAITSGVKHCFDMESEQDKQLAQLWQQN